MPSKPIHFVKTHNEEKDLVECTCGFLGTESTFKAHIDALRRAIAKEKAAVNA